MKKQFLAAFLICMCVIWGGTSYAQSQFSPVIAKIENSLFGMAYNNQNDEARLSRIEQVVYGSASTKPVQQRVSKLSSDLSADLIGQEIKPKTDTFAEEEDEYKEVIPKADSNINYPVVNKLEDQVFNKEFKTLDINKRLSNLEQKTFNRVYNDDLNARVERLKGSIMHTSDNMIAEDDDGYSGFGSRPTGGASSPYDSGNDNLPEDDIASQGNYYGPSYNTNNSVMDDYQSNNSIEIPLSALEKSVLKRSFPDDTVSNRLTRLEDNVFNSSFDQDDTETRLDRLSSAYRAKKTSKKYDSNKMSQRTSTAVQIGALLLMVLAFVL